MNNKYHKPLYTMAAGSAGVALVFCLLMYALLMGNYLQSRQADPLDSPQWRDLRSAVRANPADAKLADEFRKLDRDLREKFFAQRRRGEVGGYMIVAGLAMFIAFGGFAIALRKKASMPGPWDDGEPRRLVQLARVAVGGFAVAMLVAAGTWTFASWQGIPPGASGEDDGAGPKHGTTTQTSTSPTTGTAASKPATPAPAPTAGDFDVPMTEVMKQWASFRGPCGAGLYDGDAPTEWNAPENKGVLWKTDFDSLPGVSSPVIWGDRVYFTGADEKAREVYCIDTATGKLLWRAPVVVAGTPAEAPKVDAATGFAAPTVVTNGKLVFAMFANGDLISLWCDGGGLLWARNLGTPDNHYGHSSSLAMAGQRLFVQLDQSDEAKSALLIIDAATGKDVKSIKRTFGPSWASPIVFEAVVGQQVVLAANPMVVSYDASDGSELWRAEVLGGEVGPSPIYHGSLVYTVNVGSKLAAIRTDGKGDVGATHVAWSADKDLPDMCSPVTDGTYVFTLTSGPGATLVCYDAAKGTRLWEKELPDNFKSSPAIAGGKLYVTDEQGVTTVLAADKEYKLIGKCRLGEGVSASPAFAQGKVFIRGEKHLFCIGNAGGASAAGSPSSASAPVATSKAAPATSPASQEAK